MDQVNKEEVKSSSVVSSDRNITHQHKDDDKEKCYIVIIGYMGERLFCNTHGCNTNSFNSCERSYK
jgi:hypothetical protein